MVVVQADLRSICTNQIVELLNEFNSGSTPIIYLNAAYSRFLNEHGLYSLAKGLYNLDHQ